MQHCTWKLHANYSFLLQSINYTVCDACLHDYNVLNRHFNEMREDYDGKICMDLVDMVMYIIFYRRFTNF